jgi:isoleucyl-tRNA synthetase
MIKRVAESYRKVRNTLRYLLSNLSDFDPLTQAVPEAEMEEIDHYALARHRQFVQRVRQAYDDFEFHIVYHQLVQYCAADLSAFYLDVLKDRLYCEARTSPRRRSAQTVLLRLAEDLTRLMVVVLPFTADEVWPYIPGRREESVDLAHFPTGGGADDLVLSRWAELLEVRSAVAKALEEARAARQIGSSLEAQVTVRAPAALARTLQQYERQGPSFPGNLASLFIVSKVVVAEGGEAPAVQVERARGQKCERCWMWSEKVGAFEVHRAVCERCAAVLSEMEVLR